MITPCILHNFRTNFCTNVFHVNLVFRLTLYKLCGILKP